MKQNDEKIKVRVRRYDPSSKAKPRFQSYEVPYEEGLNVLGALNYIYEELDHSLAFRYSCRITFCGICAVVVNGKNVLGCKRIVKPGESLTIEPISKYPLIRDLVTDFGEKVK